MEPRYRPWRGWHRGRGEELLLRRKKGRCMEGGQERGHGCGDPLPKGQVVDLDAKRHLGKGAK